MKLDWTGDSTIFVDKIAKYIILYKDMNMKVIIAKVMGTIFQILNFVGAYITIWRSKVDPDAINDNSTRLVQIWKIKKMTVIFPILMREFKFYDD